MAAIRLTCPVCATPLSLSPADIELHASATGESHFGFVCATCATASTLPADDHIVDLLRQAGVRPVQPQPHPEHPSPGPPLTLDNLLDFHLLLETPGWLAELAAVVDFEGGRGALWPG